MTSTITKVFRVLSMALLWGGLLSAASEPPADAKQPAITGGLEYRLQTDDEITLHSLQAKELTEKTFRIDQNGEVNFPMAGVLHLGGNTVRQAETAIAVSLKRYYISPDVAINVTTFHTESVSVLGSVGTPGVYQLKGQTHLLEALSSAGGLRGDAGPVAILTRQEKYGMIPHHDARQKLTGESTVEVDLKGLMESQSSSENLLIAPHDVISVPAAQLIYVVGRVRKAGGFALGGKPSLSIIQALALAEGFDPQAAPERAKILRRGSTTEEQIPVNMKQILAGKAEDIILRPNDILYVPNNAMKTITNRTIEAAIQVGTGIAIFRP